MNIIELALFLFFLCGGFLFGDYFFARFNGFGHVAGVVFGGAVGVMLWVMFCVLIERKNK